MPENCLFKHIRAAIPSPGTSFMWSPDGRTITYGEMIDRSAQYARVLTEMGLQPGDRVAVQAAKSVDVILLYLGVIRAGGVYLPLNDAYTPAEVAYFLGDAEPTILVIDPEAAEIIAPVADTAGVSHVVSLTTGSISIAAAVESASTMFQDVARSSDDLAALLYTSGTTGRSKGAMLTHGNLVSNARALKTTWQFDCNDVLIHALPIFHTHGLFVAINVTLLSGSAMIVLPKFDAEAIADLVSEATCLMGVPTFYTRLLANGGLTRANCADMRLFISGSAPLLAGTHHEFERTTGHAIVERYGMTETNMIASNPYDGERRAGTVGFPLPGVAIRLVAADTGEAVEPGGIGVIEVKGPNVFSGYWRMPDKTRAEFRADGYFVTGDLGEIDQDGYLAIVGRGKDLIISGGLNVYPKEVETVIDTLAGVAESAVIGIPHTDFGEAVVAVVVPEDGARPGGDDLMTALATRLARFKQPKAILFVDSLPRNTMGKIQKNILRDQHSSLFTDEPSS
ncbi:MAG: malonyl-CoA synthase [Hyphomicrobiales bacterium]|nr:malonyl-CoA synthase [Hyphomicrobiales bacterium]